MLLLLVPVGECFFLYCMITKFRTKIVFHMRRKGIVKVVIIIFNLFFPISFYYISYVRFYTK